MNMKKHSKGSLGRGLSAILGTKSNKKEYTQDNSLARIHEISINEIQTNPFQPRINFKQEKLDELALSIKELGANILTSSPLLNFKNISFGIYDDIMIPKRIAKP